MIEAKGTARPRVGEILRMLFAEAQTRIKTTKEPNWDRSLPAITDKDRQLFREYKQAERYLRMLKRRLSKRDIQPHYSRARRGSRERTIVAQRWRMEQTERAARLRDLKIRVHLDLLGMNARETKSYILRLQKTLGRI